MRALIAILFFTASLSSAAIEVTDEGHVISDLSFLPASRVPFDQAFVCGEVVEYTATVSRCEVTCHTGCIEDCQTPLQSQFGWAAEECNSESVTIYGNGHSFRVTKNDYERYGNSILVPFLKSTGRFIEPIADILLEFSRPMNMFNVVDGQLRPFAAQHIMGSYLYPGPLASFDFTIFVSADEPGLKQLLGFQTDRESYFLKKKGMIRGQY